MPRKSGESPRREREFQPMCGSLRAVSMSLTRPGTRPSPAHSRTSSPTEKEFQEFSIKKTGRLTDWLHEMEVGQQIMIRGPYGKHFPVEGALRGQNAADEAGGLQHLHRGGEGADAGKYHPVRCGELFRVGGDEAVKAEERERVGHAHQVPAAVVDYAYHQRTPFVEGTP